MADDDDQREAGTVSREDRAITIVDLMTQVMAVIDEGEQGEQLICRTLGKSSNADAAVLVGLDAARRPRIHGAWPDPKTAAALAETAARGGGQRPGSVIRGGTHPILGEVAMIGPDFDDQASSANRGRARVFAVSRRTGFTPEAQDLLTESAAALTFLLPHIADACLRSQQARNAAEAAAALNLTPREVEVLQLLSEGLLARTIAARLGLSPRTVHKHLSNVYTKLGVHDRLVAVGIARDHGLISA